ncbi:MAG: DUF4111 domain-containing protein, partial [Chloroflexota bacterium]|nr:DUF4111 domain-containing protein [Chloroflexota bacterium]
MLETYIHTVDATAPGLLEGLYLVGSVALGDYRPHESDLDFIAVVPDRPSVEALPVLRHIHAQLRARYRRPHFDGVYVTSEDLGRNPALAGPVPSAHEGRVQWGRSGLDPIAWHTLARNGVALRGPEAADLAVWTDSDALRAWTLDNLRSYWRPWHRRFSRPLSIEGLAALGAWAPAWGVLGVSRLHYTLLTGEIISKEGAGIHALSAFPPRWQRIIEECLRIRRGRHGSSLYR